MRKWSSEENSRITMAAEQIIGLEGHLSGGNDPWGRNATHPLSDIIDITIPGTNSRIDVWVECEQFGYQKLNGLSQNLFLPKGIPPHDTFGRVFVRINFVDCQANFMDWV
jgi:hypothetical protein